MAQQAGFGIPIKGIKDCREQFMGISAVGPGEGGYGAGLGMICANPAGLGDEQWGQNAKTASQASCNAVFDIYTQSRPGFAPVARFGC